MLLALTSTSCTGDEFENVYSQINGLILQQEKKFSRNLKDSIESATKIHETLSHLNSTDLKEFKQQFVDMVDNLKIDLPDGDLGKLLETIGTNVAPLHDVIERINRLKEYVGNSLKWYDGLEITRRIYDYPYLKKSSPDSVNRTHEYVTDETTAKPFKNFPFARKFAQYDPAVYNIVKDLHVNTYRLNLLHAVVDQERNRKFESMCGVDNSIRIEGFNIILSDVVQEPCYETANFTEIFALNRVFIDVQIVKPSLEIIIISPTWIIVPGNFNPSDAMIKLTGESPHFTRAPVQLGVNGEDGEMGEPGGWGGSFVGFGGSIDGEVNGGQGSHGAPG